MFFARIGIFLLLFLTILGTSNAAVFNENYTNLYVDKSSWCSEIEVFFKVYNETDYDNIAEVDKDDDDDIYIRNISDAQVTIYNGPLDALPVLIETTTNKTGEFSITFPSANQYLLFISPEDEYNEYEEVLDIEECEFASETEEEVEAQEEETESESEFEELLESAEEEEETVVLDKSYSYLENTVSVDLIGTESTSATQLDVKKVSVSELENKDITVLDNTLSSVEIQSETTFDSATVTLEIDDIANVNKAFRYNSDSDTWEAVESSLAGNSIIIETEEFGIFSVTGFLPAEPEVIVEELSEQEPQSGVDALSMILPFALFGIVAILVFGGGIYFAYGKFVKKKNENDPLGSVTERKKGELEEGENPHKELTSYNEVEEKTRAYIMQYKDKYSKDQIYRALTQAHVPKDIIDKVFLQVFD